MFSGAVCADDGAPDTLDICRYLEKYEKGADYVSGVDVHGRAVVPADVDGASVQSSFLTDPIVIPVQIDLVKRFGLALPADITLEPTVSQMKIYSDGRVSYNDHDISDRLHRVCRENSERDQKINSANGAQEHGHEAVYPVGSSDKIEGQYPDDDTAISPRYNE